MENDEIGLPQHDLEAHIDGLRELDKIRAKVKEFHKGGTSMFRKNIEQAFGSAGFEPSTFLDKNLDIVYAAWLSGTGTDIARLKTVTQEAANGITLNDLLGYRGSILASGQLMQLLAMSGKFALSTSSFLCWYVVIRELFSATAPDWSIGAARAGQGKYATVSAYATSHAVRGILCLARTLERTAELLNELTDFDADVKALNNPLIPQEWRDAELERLQESHEVSIALLIRSTIVDPDSIALDCRTGQSYLDGIGAALKASLDMALTSVEASAKQIAAYRATEDDPDRKSRRRRDYIESGTGHSIAHAALTRTIEDVKEALELAKDNDREKLAKAFQEAAARIRNGVSPARIYLRSVIDAQLSAFEGSPRDRNAAELAFAAFAYAELTPPTDSDHTLLRRAFARVCDELGDDGTLPRIQPFHKNDDKVSWLVSHPHVLVALAHLMHQLRVPIPIRQAKKIHDFFEHNKREIVDELRPHFGWSFELGPPVANDMVGTGNALWALGEFQDLLDETINHIILEHFSVKRPGKIKLDLDALYYPDFGFALAPQGINRKSIALQLQNMRRHIVLRSDKRRKSSLALYGPAGTGKTTLIEALAKSCGVPMVEVTPSDIAKGGEASIEQRARAVFEALSMLTRVVILFDEFDPILKRRSSDDDRPSNMFSFLTPGMLPKLKNLHEAAKDNSTAYALITNLVGSLDEAAVREGRFDDKYGVFPPDPLSRYGRFVSVHRLEEGSLKTWRLAEVIQSTAGLGMTAMASRTGWFRALDGDERNGTLIHYAQGGNSALPSMPDPEDIFKKALNGRGQHAEREYAEWGWLCDWENACSSGWKAGIDAQDDSMSPHELMRWPSGSTSSTALATRKSEIEALKNG